MSEPNPLISQFNTVLGGGTYADINIAPNPSSDIISWVPPFTDITLGIPLLDSSSSRPQTVQYLWEIFFKEFVKISPEVWNTPTPLSFDPEFTNATYYTQVFKETLQKWFSTLSSGTNNLPYINTDGPAPPLPGQPVPGTPSGDTPVIFNLPPGTTQGTFTFQDWLIMDTPVSWYALQTNYLHVAWTAYLTSINIGARTQSAFLWVYLQLIALIRNVEVSAINQGQRVSALVTAQQTSISAISFTISKFRTPINSSDSLDLAYNQQYQMWIQVYQGNASVTNSFLSQQNNNVQQATQSVQDLDSLMTNLIQQMQTILSNLFRN